MKRLSILLVTLFLIGCENDDFDFSEEISIPVSVEDIKLKSIEEYIDATGTLQAAKEVILYSELSGFYKLNINRKTGKPYALGDRVKKGEEIIFLDDPEYVNNIRIDLKKLQLEQAKTDYEKQKSLYDKGGVTLTQLKTAERNYINEEYTYENSLILLEKMRVRAPFDGVIVDLPYYTPGTRVNQGSPLMRLMNYDELYLEVNLPEKQLGVVKVNGEVRVMNYTLTDDTLKGKVTQISPAIESSTRTFKTTMEIDNPDGNFRPGMFVRTELTIAKKDSTIVIPKNIILSRQRGKTVFVIEKGASDERIITTGLENPNEVEVIKGLKENERLVVRGFETLRRRQKVKIIK